jgi:serine/threonine protein kinase
MSEAILKKFGKYFLLDRVGEGGMAEIFRARLSTLENNGRFVVIKRIMGEYSNNHEFVNMFKSEVQVTMRFSHPNVVQIFEAGEENNQPYIAMEFIDGRNLRQILSKSSQKQQPVPIPGACYIVEQAALGLHYAHAFKDRITGEALHLVHRDVSPQNILVSYDGNIKVIDFGIAKANTSGEATRAGVIKGKLSYLSPEQVLGDVLDGRSDLFALGIVLWETLTGRRLFVAEGDNEFQVLKMIESCTTFVKPPSQFNPSIVPELDEVVMQALSRDPRKRFQSGEEFARALRRILAIHFSDFGPSDLSQYVKKMFHEVIVEDRKNLQTVNARADELIKLGKFKSLDDPTLSNLKNKSNESTRMTDFIGDRFNKAEITNAEKLEVAVQPPRQMKVAASKPVASHPGQNTRTSTRTIAKPKPVELPRKSGSALGKVIGVAGLGAVAYFGNQYYTNKISGEVQQLERKVAQTQGQNQISNPNQKSAQLKIRIFPDGDFARTRVLINSQPFDLEKGVSEVPVGEPLSLVVERQGFVTYRKEFTLQEGELNSQRESSLDVKLEPMVYGLFSLSTRPSMADVTIINLDRASSDHSKPMIFKTPISQEKLQAGNYRLIIQNELLGVEKTLNVTIRNGKEVVMTDVQLELKK